MSNCETREGDGDDQLRREVPRKRKQK